MTNKTALRRLLLTATVVAGMAAGVTQADAALTLTAAGIADGYSLSTFVSGFPDTNGNGTGVGPIGVGFLPGGGTVVANYSQNTMVAFPSDADGQTLAGGTQYGGFSLPVGVANVGSNVYVTNQGNGTLSQLNSNGSFGSTVVSGLGFATGIAANPTNGHIFVSDVSSVIWDVDPVANTKSVFLSGVAVDGITFSPDGSTLFMEVGQHIVGVNVTTHAQTDYGFVSGADGAAAATGALTGQLFVDTNFGQIVQIDEATFAQTVIATGGSRGDLVTIDPNGSLLLSQSDSVVRLTLPAGSTFTNTPEPATVSILAGGLLALAGLRRRKR